MKLDEAAQNRSLVTFIRRALKIKGKSEHTGRGAYWMRANSPVDYDDLIRRLRSLIPTWQEKGLIVDVIDAPRDGVHAIEIMFSTEYFDDYYRIFYTNEMMVKPHGRNDKITLLGGVAFALPENNSLRR